MIGSVEGERLAQFERTVEPFGSYIGSGPAQSLWFELEPDVDSLKEITCPWRSK